MTTTKKKKPTGQSPSRPSPLIQADSRELASVQGICLDIDDTLSTRGKLTAEAYSSLWEAKKAGFAIVPITGRPAGWCDHFARFWPIDAVVGENGAFTFFMDRGVRRRVDTPSSWEKSRLKPGLEDLRARILARFPHAKWASDQSYREFDLAIDICEDVRPWPDEDVQELLKLCKDAGAHAKLSSIHVNTWFGDYDKKSGFEHWLSQGAPGMPGSAPPRENWVFIGDSPNDEPMFAHFPLSVGVANLRAYLPNLKSPPRWITEGESGLGFRELVDRLLNARFEARG